MQLAPNPSCVGGRKRTIRQNGEGDAELVQKEPVDLETGPGDGEQRRNLCEEGVDKVGEEGAVVAELGKVVHDDEGDGGELFAARKAVTGARQ